MPRVAAATIRARVTKRFIKSPLNRKERTPNSVSWARGVAPQLELATAGYPTESPVKQQAAKDTKESRKSPGESFGPSSCRAGASPHLGHRSPLRDPLGLRWYGRGPDGNVEELPWREAAVRRGRFGIIDQALRTGRPLVGRVILTDEHGWPWWGWRATASDRVVNWGSLIDQLQQPHPSGPESPPTRRA